MPAEWEVFFDKSVREIAKERTVVDVGGGRPFQKGMEKYRELFKKSRYYSLDYDSKSHPHIVGDVHMLPFKSGSIDAIICRSVLEHVPEPQKAMREMYRVLRKGGKIFVYVPFLHPYHSAPSYKDYYRYTKDGVRYMFRDFAKVDVVKVRGHAGTLLLFLPDILSKFFSPFARFFDKHIEAVGPTNGLLKGGVTSGFCVFAIK